MERRRFMAVIAGGLLAAPLAVEGQPPGKVARVGYLHPGEYFPLPVMGLDALRPGLPSSATAASVSTRGSTSMAPRCSP